MLNQEIGLEHIGMIKVLPASLLVAEVSQVQIIVIEMEVRALQLARQLFRKSRLPRPRPTRNAHDHRSTHCCFSPTAIIISALAGSIRSSRPATRISTRF